jgi:hypothetical protein
MQPLPNGGALLFPNVNGQIDFKKTFGSIGFELVSTLRALQETVLLYSVLCCSCSSPLGRWFCVMCQI